MKHFIVLCFLLSIYKIGFASDLFDTVSMNNDTVIDLKVDENYLPLPEIDYRQFQSRFQERSLGNKILRGTAYVFGYNSMIGVGLALAPESFTQWNKEHKFRIPVMLDQYHLSYTQPPVIDRDLWVVNYIGHPYQGGLYYNAMRSQGATIVQSSLFCLSHTLMWEYVWEGGMEQPSIQDLIVTPVVGGIIGELSHRASIKMSKNGYSLTEKIIMCLINPTYVLNNGFKVKSLPK